MVFTGALVAALLVGAVGLAVLRRAVQQARLVTQMSRLAPAPVASPGGALQLVHGTLEGEPLLRSPWQDRPCIYYFFRVLQPQEGKKPRSIATGKQWTVAHVRDASGAALVQGEAALVASPRRHEEVIGPLAKIPPGKEFFFEAAGIDEKHLPRFDRLIIHEYTLEPGDDVYVTGMARSRAGEKVFYRKSRTPLIVSAERDIGYLGPLRHELWLYVGLAPLLLAGAAVLAFLAFA